VTAILGISAFNRDSAAALVRDGDIVAAAQEERFTRRKHDARFPEHAVAWCLHEAVLRPDDIDFIAFYEKPLVRMSRALQSYLALAPRGLASFAAALPAWLKQRLNCRRRIRAGVNATRPPLIFLHQHESHAASAFFPSPFEEAAVLTLDGVGGWTTTACGLGRGNRLELTHHIGYPHSLGLLYSAFSYYCGFDVDGDEEGLMDLAPFGRPVYRELITARLIDIKPDGSFWLNTKFFNCCPGQALTNRRFECLFGGPPRRPESTLLQRHMDLAASIQAVTQDVLLRLGRDLHCRTGMRNIVLAGSMALNGRAIGRLVREGPFDSLWVQPAAGDAGCALGAALFVWHQILNKARDLIRHASSSSLLGPAFETREILRALGDTGLSHRHVLDEAELLARVASALAEEKVVGWFSGKLEFGPRALGARSILSDARSPRMQAMMSRKIKCRESYRPFAAAVLAEHAHQWFGARQGEENPYMNHVAPLHKRHRHPLSDCEKVTMDGDPDLCRRVNVVRSAIPAVTHVDYSAFVQTIDRATNPRFYRLLQAFYRRTGCPMLAQSTLKLPGEPIVCTPQEALRVFRGTDIDLLVMENVILSKDVLEEAHLGRGEYEDYLAPFRID
jgi:carbamoyltransferase